MPYDAFGNFTRSYNWTSDKLANIKIQSTRMDGEFDNYATALNQVLLRNGVAAWTGDQKLGNNKITGVASGLVGSPGFQFSTDPTTGFYLPSAGTLGLVAGGVETVRATASGAYVIGSLYIGSSITAPRTTVDIGGLTSLKGVFEETTVQAVALSGTTNVDFKTTALVINTSNASANFSFNLRGDGSNSLNSIMGIGQTLTCTVEVPQGATPYYCTTITVDGNAPAQLKWFGGAPSTGNASGIDVYTITVIKTASNTFYVRASMSQVV